MIVDLLVVVRADSINVAAVLVPQVGAGNRISLAVKNTFVQVPNLRSIWARWALQEDVPRHLYFFTPPTLRAFGEKAGLSWVRVRR